jgi:hypothetical protein
VYLPTHGRDAEFVTALAALDATILHILEDFDCPIYIRGDCNVNPKNTQRMSIFKHFLAKFSLSSLDLAHPTHHHFTGAGASDSQLDLLLYHGPPARAESLSSITCSLSDPLVTSQHDIIHSSFTSPRCPIAPDTGNVCAPKVTNTRIKIRWSDEGIKDYEALVSPCLARLRARWTATGPASFSILLAATTDALTMAARSTNTSINLSKNNSPKSTIHPEVKAAQLASLAAAQHVRSLAATPGPDPAALTAARQQCSATRAALARATRALQAEESAKRDELLHSVLDTNPAALYKSISAHKSGSTRDVQKLNVGEKIYTGAQVTDGFFDALSTLKAPDMTDIHASASFKRYNEDYKHIMKICSAGVQIPSLSGKDAMALLHSLRADVNDLYSTTAAHYIHAGMEGAIHFTFLINTIIHNINLSSIDALNSVWAMVLFKGHGKDRESARSYRTISTCPLLAKALDKHVGALYESGWAAAQAETQYQGTGSSHELAALLLTETVQYSLYVAEELVFVLLLDAMSAFDKILREICVREAFLAGSKGEGLVYIDNRLKNRKTFLEWNKIIMGPISDKLGVEQGGVNSDRLYKLANNAELKTAQLSQLGVHLGPVHVASIGQADDVALVSNCPYKLNGLLALAMQYAADSHITMVPEKTKLLCYTPRGREADAMYWEAVSPVTMAGLTVPFSREAEHVGILRCTAPGSMASVLARLSAHTRAMYAVLPAGLARGHRGNPAAALRVESLYGLPVLLSGLAAMVLGKAELEALDMHHKVSLERLQRLYPRTPAPVVYFLAGTLPASATYHLRQLGLLGMVARLGPESVLYRYGRHILANPPSPSAPASSPWFIQIRAICTEYGLPDPLYVLATAPSKGEWKGAARRQVLAHHGARLRAHAASLPSLTYLRSSHMSLSGPSPLWTSCKDSQHEVRKATIQARMLSGRYRTCWLRRHWSGDTSGVCRVPGCTGDSPGTLLHLATGQCPGLAAATTAAARHWSIFLHEHPALSPIIHEYASGDPEDFLGFLLDPSTRGPVLALAQLHGALVVDQFCHLTRSWLYLLHRERFRKLGLWAGSL